MPIPKEKKYTSEEFFRLTAESKKRQELIDGEIFDMASPNILHQTISKKIFRKIDDYITQNNGKYQAFYAPTDVKLDENNIVVPDIFIAVPDFFVACDPNKFITYYYTGSPDFIIEITSTNYTKDYEKIMLYKESGVREYWIIDTRKEKVIVLFFEKNPNSFTLYKFSDDIPVSIYDGNISINISELLMQG